MIIAAGFAILSFIGLRQPSFTLVRSVGFLRNTHLGARIASELLLEVLMIPLLVPTAIFAPLLQRLARTENNPLALYVADTMFSTVAIDYFMVVGPLFYLFYRHRMSRRGRQSPAAVAAVSEPRRRAR